MRNRFDQFMKQMLWAAFSRAGMAERDAEVSPEAQHIDLWFVPDRARVRLLNPLGLIARIARRPCALEAYHRTPTADDFDGCQRKHFNFRHVLSRKEPNFPVPLQWVLSSGRPTAALRGFGCRRARGWPRGVYAGPPRLWLRVVAVSELPLDRSTLLLRLLGAGKVLKQAITELDALPDDAPEKCVALPVLLRLRLQVPKDPAKQTSEDEEFLMSTQDVVEKWERKVRKESWRQGLQEGKQQGLQEGKQQGLQEGKQQGLQEGKQQGLQQGLTLARRAVINLYEVRFGPMPASLRARLERTADPDVLARVCDVASAGTRLEIEKMIRNG